MTWMKRIQPGERIGLKLTQAERRLVEGLTALPPHQRQIIRSMPLSTRIMLTLGDLESLAVYVTAEASRTAEKKLQEKLDRIQQKIQHLLETHTDEDDEEALVPRNTGQKRSHGRTDLRAGQSPSIIPFRLKTSRAPKSTNKADQTYPLSLTASQRKSILHTTRLRRGIKQKIEHLGEGTQTVRLIRKELDDLNDELAQAAAFVPDADRKRLVAVQKKVIALFERADVATAGIDPHLKRQRPADPSTVLFQFKITLLDIKPAIWRRIQVPDCTLDVLHEYIQRAFGWWNYHLHQFIIEGERFGPAAPDDLDFGMEMADETAVSLSELLSKSGKRTQWLYEYDFGDGWRHEIVFEGYPVYQSGQKYPQCVDGARACPPEDVGGPWGYVNFLTALTDPDHERHDELLEWRGPFDPEAFDPQQATKEMRKVQ